MKKVVMCCMLIAPIFTMGQTTATDSIKTVIHNFFDGMKRKDTAFIRTLVTPGIRMQSVVTTAKGTTKHTEEKIEDWFNQLVSLPASIKTIDERITFEQVLVDEAMAMAWTPFRLYLNDTLYSCGVNHFQLVKLNGAWKVNFIIDTRRSNCK
jgi:hypothetical protein